MFRLSATRTAPRDKQELVPLTDDSGRPNDVDLDGHFEKIPPIGHKKSDYKGLWRLANNVTISLTACLQIIGMGTLWRFPYVYFKYGGGTFLIPYTIILCLVGYPLLIMEIGIGQKLRCNSILVWSTINPQLQGIGIVMTIVTMAMACYYGTIIAWVIKYIFEIFKFLQFSPSCLIPMNHKRNLHFWHNYVLNVTSSLDESSDIQTSQAYSLLITWLFMAIVLGAFCIKYKNQNVFDMNSSNSVRKFVSAFIKFTAIIIVPMIFIFNQILNSRYGYNSLLYITSIELKDLLVLPIWIDAVIQVFCSLSLVHGMWTSFGSHTNRKNNFVFTALFVIITNINLVFIWTWFIASVMIPDVLDDVKACVIGSAYKWVNSKGMSAHMFYGDSYDELIVSRKLDDTLTNLDLQECNMNNKFKLASSSMAVVFMALEEFAKPLIFPSVNYDFQNTKFVFDYSHIIIISFGVICLSHLLGYFVWSISEIKYLKKVPKFYISIIVCAICCICGLVFTTRSGVYWLSLYNDIFINSCLTVLALCEVLIIIYIYGYKQFLFDIYDMAGTRISRVSMFIWKFITPMLLVLTFSSILTIGILDGLRYDVWTHKSNSFTKTKYPYWAQLTVWTITALCLMSIMIFCMVNIQQILNFKFFKSLIKMKKTACGHINQSNKGLSEKGIITEIDFDECPDSENDEELDTSMTQAPVRMYKIEVLDSWKSARGQVYL